MMWVRKRSTSRVFAVVLILSILPTLMVPSGRASSSAKFGSHEGWLRAQLLAPADDLVDLAIAVAVESGAESFDGFIAAFLEAYADAAPGEPISQVFTDRNLSDDALITFLQRRYSQVVDVGVLPRLYLTSFVQNSAVGGKSGPSYTPIKTGSFAPHGVEDPLSFLAEYIIVISFRTLSSAHSLGP